MGREFPLGEWGADEHDNIFYLGGWIASGVVVLGDVRDIAATISRGDLVGTGLNLAALIPGYGDAAKVSVIVGKFVVVHPELLKPAMVLMVGVAPHVDEVAESVKVIRKVHGDELIDALKTKGVSDSKIIELHNLDQIGKVSLRNIDEGLGILRGSGKTVGQNIGDVAEIIAEETVLKERYPASNGYVIINNVVLKGATGNELREIDHVVVKDDVVVAIGQTKTNRDKAKTAQEQINKDVKVINSNSFSSTNSDLKPEQFRSIMLETFTVGPKDGAGYDHVLDYSGYELHGMYKTWSEINGNRV